MTFRFCCAVLLMTAASLTAGCTTTSQNHPPVASPLAPACQPVTQDEPVAVVPAPATKTIPVPAPSSSPQSQPGHIRLPAPQEQLSSVQRLDQLKTARTEAEAHSAMHSPAPKPPQVEPAARPKKPSPPLTIYKVGHGENLYGIAAKEVVFNEGLLWPLIYRANRDQIKDPQQIFPGQQLTIPRDLSEAEKESARETARQSGIFLP